MKMPTQPSLNEFSAVVRCPPDTVDDAHNFLEQVWLHRPEVTPADRMVLETALSELVTNVVQKNRHRSVLCEVTVAVTPDLLVLEISDDGDEPREVPPTRTMPSDDAESGRGLALIRMISDDLGYRRIGLRNVWRVEKLRSRPLGARLADGDAVVPPLA